jgi:hypothetical protein
MPADGAGRAAPRVLDPARPFWLLAHRTAHGWTCEACRGSGRMKHPGVRGMIRCLGCNGTGGAPAIADPAELWEALSTSGVIPDAWVGDAGRAFACDSRRCACEGREQRPHPWSVAACVAFASDVAGVTQAEALARECVARLAPWGAPQPQRVVWRVVDPATWRPARVDALAQAERETFPPGPPSPPMPPRRGETWALRAFRDHTSAHKGWPARNRGLWRTVRLPDRADPFEPLLALWATGYALDAITDDAVVLVCPSLGTDDTVTP